MSETTVKRIPKVGETASLTLTITDEMVRRFAELSGDNNPVHLDDAYAAKTRFKRRIAHGMLVSSTFSKLAGMQLPGPGTIIVSQETRYKAPCYIGDTVTAQLKIVSVREDKPIIKIENSIHNQNGDLLTEGEAILFYDPV